MRARAATLAWLACGLSLALVAATVGLVVLNRESIDNLREANAIEIVLPVSYALLGGLVASRQPLNPMGWLFLAIAFSTALQGTTAQYSRYALLTEPSAPFTPWIAWMGYVSGTLVYPGGLAALALLLLPNGRLLSPRWGFVALAGIVLTIGILALTVLDPRGIIPEGLPPIPNPTGVPEFDGTSSGTPGSLLFLAGLMVIGAAAISVVLRFRRGGADERLQLRWVAVSVAFAVGLNVVFTVAALAVLPQSTVASLQTVPVVIGFGIVMPAGFAVAMLRYRLYDLDLLLNRTLLYSAVSVVLVVLFAVANLLARQLLLSVAGQPLDYVSAALGLVAGLAFGPVRRWLRPVVDRALPARARLALLFTDIVESTQTIVDLGDEDWRELLDRYRATVRHALARHHGREINTAGDGFFATFDRPANAARCAIAIRDGVSKLGLQVRTGLHLGDVEMRGEQISGLAVHATARVMGQANPNEILLSAELAEVLPEVSMRDAGVHTLRGVPGEWQLFQVAGSA